MPLQTSNTLTTETFKLKRENFLNQLIDGNDKVNDSESAFFQKRLTQADLRSAVKSQLDNRVSLEKLEGSATGRKSVNGIQKSRNTPAVYSLATEKQIRTVRN